MVCLAMIEYRGIPQLAAQQTTSTNDYEYVSLSAIASDARAFLSMGSAALLQAQKLIADSATPRISATHVRLLAPLDGSLVGKLLCIGTYKE